MLGSIFGIVILIVGVSAVAFVLISMPQHKYLCLTLMIFTTCIIKKPFYQEVFFQDYRGVDRGFGVTLPDLFFFGFALWILMGGLKRRTVWLPFNTLPWLAMIAISMMSLAGSAGPLYGLFTIHKMVRCLVFYWVVVNVVRDRRDINAVLLGLVAAAVHEGVLVFWTKYVTQTVVFRSHGSFPHSNSLAMYLQMVLPILLGVILVKGFSKKANSWALVGLGLGFMAVIFTKSRTSMVILPAALGGVVVTSILFRPTLRKVALLGAGLVAVSGVASIALPRIIRRFQNAPEESKMTRVYFNYAALAMARDRPFGVGINQYSWYLTHTDYYWYVYPDKVDLDDPEAFRESRSGRSRLGTAHHIYLLFAAETGWIGMVCFIVFLARFYLRNVVLFFKAREEYHRAILLGLLAGMAMLHLQGTLEWIWRQTQAMYLYFALNGLMIAVGRQMRSKRPRRAS